MFWVLFWVVWSIVLMCVGCKVVSLFVGCRRVSGICVSVLCYVERIYKIDGNVV